MELSYDQQPSSRRLVGFVAVVVLHIFIFYALVSGLARNVVEIVKKPLETKIILDIPLPPPPPPPPPPPKEIVKPQQAPKVEAPPPPYVPPPEIAPPVSAAPPITVVAEPPKVEYKIEAPPPAPAPAPAPASRSDIGVACPTQVKPELPRKAIQDGVSGVVRAQARISGGVVKEVTILSGPRVFHSAVRSAMLAYKCVSTAEDVTAIQEFEFKIE